MVIISHHRSETNLSHTSQVFCYCLFHTPETTNKTRQNTNIFRKIPEKVPDAYSGDAKPKYNFTKKMGQLDAAIKLLTTKVEEKIMKEK